MAVFPIYLVNNKLFHEHVLDMSILDNGQCAEH